MSTLPRPSLRSMTALLLTLWLIVTSGVRVFAWDSLSEGMIDLRPLTRALRVVTVVGLGIVGLFLASILFNDVLRQSGTLESLPLESGAERGLFVPSLAIPLTLVVIALGWALMLTGALRTRWWVRWLVLVLFIFFGVTGMITGTFQGLAITQPIVAVIIPLILGAALLGLVLAFLLLPLVRLPFIIEFALILAFISALLLANLYSSAEAQRITGTDFVGGYMVPSMVREARNIILPFLFVAGVEWANFAVTASSWITQASRRHATPFVLTLLLGAILVYRLGNFGVNTVIPGIDLTRGLHYAGAALTLAGVGLIWLWRRRKDPEGEVPGRLVIGLILGGILFQLLLSPIITAISFLALFNPLQEGVLANQNSALAVVLELSELYQQYFFLVVAFAGALVALIALRRRNFTVAAFGMILAWMQFWWWMMQDGRPLERLRYAYSDLDVVLLMVLSVVTLYWLARRALTPDRALALLGLAMLAWLLNNTEFLDNPFSPLFGFAGVLFLAFGILWNVLTVGGRLTNSDSRHFPRGSRILLYLGYVLLALAVTHWYIVTHHVAEQTLHNDLTFNGFRVYGLAVAMLVFAEGGRQLVKIED